MAEEEDKNARRARRRATGGKVHPTRSNALQAPVWRDGLWRRPGLPTFGWTCVAVEPPTSAQCVCMACNRAFDGPSHVLSHQSYDGTVRVDPICSANMQRTVAEVHAPSASVTIDRVAERARWLGRAWKRNADGESVLSTREFHTIVSFTGRTWGFTVRRKMTELEWDRAGFRSCDEAKLAAFDEITKRKVQQASHAMPRTIDNNS